MSKKILKSDTKFQKLRCERINSICCDYITYASEIATKRVSPWRVICNLAEKYEITKISVYNALRAKKIYCSRKNPVSKDGVDNFLGCL